MFTHLHTHTEFSLLDGLAKIDALMERAQRLGQEALAITDHGNLYGALDFYSAGRRAGVHPILGMEAYVAAGKMTERNAAARAELGQVRAQQPLRDAADVQFNLTHARSHRLIRHRRWAGRCRSRRPPARGRSGRPRGARRGRRA